MDWARRIVPPVWLLLALLASVALNRWLPIAQLLRPPANRCGLVLIVAGALLAVAGVASFRRARTSVIPFERSTALVTYGIYRFTRNPMYLGLTAVLAGVALLLGSVGALVPLPLFVFIIHYGYIRAEERFLADIFGGQYAQYTDAVRRWL
jgi:protein-S-isoprenylcysteine O-methyltransferase Ste14